MVLQNKWTARKIIPYLFSCPSYLPKYVSCHSSSWLVCFHLLCTKKITQYSLHFFPFLACLKMLIFFTTFPPAILNNSNLNYSFFNLVLMHTVFIVFFMCTRLLWWTNSCLLIVSILVRDGYSTKICYAVINNTKTKEEEH